jgi:prepilin-type N-terminal cleavage/methylation domain-containing protein
MTTTTLSPTRKRASRRGFTLVEVMISAGLGAFLLAAVLSTFLFMGRSGTNLQNYSDMEGQARQALEAFAEDVRQASAITWNSNVSMTLTVNSASVVYEYDSSAKTFSSSDRTTANSSTKQVQISLEASRTNTTVVAATNTVLSARFILRNKVVTA